MHCERLLRRCIWRCVSSHNTYASTWFPIGLQQLELAALVTVPSAHLMRCDRIPMVLPSSVSCFSAVASSGAKGEDTTINANIKSAKGRELRRQFDDDRSVCLRNGGASVFTIACALQFSLSDSFSREPVNARIFRFRGLQLDLAGCATLSVSPLLLQVRCSKPLPIACYDIQELSLANMNMRKYCGFIRISSLLVEVGLRSIRHHDEIHALTLRTRTISHACPDSLYGLLKDR